MDWSSRHLHGPQPAEGRGPRAGPGPLGLHPLAGLSGRPKPEALGMKSFFSSNFKGSQTQGSPSILSLALCPREPRWWEGKGIGRNEVGGEGRENGNCAQLAAE